MLSLKVSLEVLAKTMIHVLCEIPGAISWGMAAECSTEQSRTWQDPITQQGIAEVRSCKKQESHVDLQQLEISLES